MYKLDVHAVIDSFAGLRPANNYSRREKIEAVVARINALTPADPILPEAIVKWFERRSIPTSRLCDLVVIAHLHKIPLDWKIWIIGTKGARPLAFH